MFRPVLSRRFVPLAVAAAAAAGIGVGSLSACSSGGGQSVGTAPAAATAPAPAVSVPSSAPAPAPMPSAPASPLTPDQASAIALQASPGTVTEVEQDVESTGPVFDVKIQHPDGTETKVQVDATTGQVTSTETDGVDTPNDPTDQPGNGH